MSQIDEIVKIIKMVTKSEGIEVNDNLKEKGVTSLNLMTILANLESVFDIEIPDEELILSNFETVAAIDNLVTKLIEE